MKMPALPWLRPITAPAVAKTAAGTLSALFVLAAVLWLVFPQSVYLLGLKKQAAEPSGESAKDDSLEIVTLSQEHATKAGLSLGQAARQRLQPMHDVPGKAMYHASRRLELRAPVEAVVREVLAEAGDRIEPGQKLAVLVSAEVGLARDQVARCEADLKLARLEADWHELIDNNLQELLSTLKQRPEVSAVEERFQDRPLGAYRDQVFTAYSRLALANQTISGTQALEEQGVLASRLAQERRSAREVQAAQFLSACETSRFESRLEKERAEAQAEQAQRLLDVSRAKLRTLLGPYAIEVIEAGDSLSEFTLYSPLAGRVEERRLVPAERVSAGDTLLSLADTSVLWISAEIHEREWNALTLVEGASVTIRAPAILGREFRGQVRFVGARVHEETRSVPLVAELDNAEGLFKPGMFVWVSVPVAETREVVAVKPTAVVRHEEQSFVFVPEGPTTFRRVNVQLGIETREWIEIASGLAAGEPVVEQGAVLLKSELLLPTLEE